MTRETYAFGASVRGPLHRKEGRPNEDAWLREMGGFGALIVVCDGLGSRPQASDGSRAACLAVKEAVLRWSKVDCAPVSLLSHLIEVYWRLRIHPIKPCDAATTCLLAFAAPNGSWLLGGIGDGLVVARTGAEVITVIGGDRDGFTNETNGLGVSSGPQDWSFVELLPTRQDRMALLATDGVSEDLLPDRLGGFCDWLVSSTQFISAMNRWRWLVAELKNWPTPGHLDDKTVAVLRQPATGKD